ncbi:MAG: hypothetical protein IJ544_08165 [Prevotella sp.]|nr:hypothetical protein [Prevotella sp.]
MKKLSLYAMLAFAGLFMASCGLEDNEFAGLKTAEADGAVVVPGFTAGQLGVIDLNTVEVSDAQDVQAFTVSETALPEGVVLSKGEIEFEDGTVLGTTADGKVSGEALSAYVSSIYGLRPEARTVVGQVCLYAVQNGAAVKIDAGKLTFQVVPKAPVIAAAYYLTGTINDWNNTNTDFELSNGGQDPYANPTFTCALNMEALGNPTSIEFKATPVDGLGGDWSGCLAAGEEGKFNYNNDGGNFKIEDIKANTKIIRLTFNMLDQTWSYTEVAFNEYIYEIGNETSWSTSHPLFGANSDGKYQGYYFLNGEFKFKPNADNWEGDWGQSPDAPYGTLVEKEEWNCWLEEGEGFYRIDVDIDAMTWALKKINYVSIIGTTNGNWDTDTDLTYNQAEGCWEVTCDLNAGEMKFRGNHNWDGDVDLGGSFDNLVHGGSNIAIEAGNYTIKLYISVAGQHKAVVTKN